MRDGLLEWYRPRRRIYPWRSARPDPYRVLVSEVMLQQTQVARVIPAFQQFIRRFPTIRSLAAAPRAEILRAWSGLGYNRRAVSLSEAARRIVRDHAGRVPSKPEVLRALPGIGPYTAAAVASLSFGLPIATVDTNVARVVSRCRLGAEPQEIRRKALEVAAADWLHRKDPAAWNQALMDLGREVCRPVPRCEDCPLSGTCRFRAARRRPAASPRPRSPFAGSSRQSRGAVVRLLGERASMPIGDLAREMGEPPDRVAEAVRALVRDGLVQASAAALDGHAGGRARLSDA